MTYPFKPSLFRSLLLFAAFSGGLGGALVSCTSSGQSGDPGDIAILTECGGTSWPSGQDEAREASCERESPYEWLCSCGDGTERVSEADLCSGALLEACGIDENKPDHCEVPEFGACWLDAELGGFNCLCASGGVEEDWRVGEGSDCEEALVDTCVIRCESDIGACSSSVPASGLSDSDPFYSCECWADSAELEETTEAGTFADTLDCESIIASVCGGSCENRAGTCVSQEGGYDCSCKNGVTGSVSTARGQQECEEAVEAMCPEALRPSGNSPLALRDYGELCEEDADCEDGACYVPGTKEDPICSKACASDSDCPSGSACFSNHCFISCEENDDEGCLALNGALANPLFCLNLDSIPEVELSGNICIQETEP